MLSTRRRVVVAVVVGKIKDFFSQHFCRLVNHKIDTINILSSEQIYLTRFPPLHLYFHLWVSADVVSSSSLIGGK